MKLPISNYGAVLLANARTLDKRFRVTSLYRSPAAQAKLYNAWLRRGKTGLPAAPPGHSMHELGEAIDIARGVDPFKDEALAQLGAWWQANGLGWSPSDPVHFQLQPIPQHAAGLAAGERTMFRGPAPVSAAEAPINHPSVTRGLVDARDPPSYPMLPGSVSGEPSMPNLPDALVKKAGAAALAAIAGGGGLAGAAAAAEAALAAAPAAAPLAVAGIIAGIIGEHFDDLVSGRIDPFFDATTPEAQARSRRQALLMKQDLAESGYKFARKGIRPGDTL